MQNFVEEEADALEECVDILLATPTLDEPVPKAQLSNKGSGKGKGNPLRVPQMGDADGPAWVKRGSVFGYKLVIGDLPRDITDVGSQFCVGHEDVAVERQSSSDLAFAVITFTDAALGIKAFEVVSMTKFDLGAGELHWPFVHWYKSGTRARRDGQQANA